VTGEVRRAGRGRGWTPLLVLTLLGFGGYVLLLPVVPLWVASGGSGAFGAGAGTGVFMLVTVLTQPGVPWALRHHGYRPVLAGGLVLLGAPTPLTALSADLAPVLALAAVRGVGFGLLTVAGSAMVAELVAPAQLGRATAVYGLAIGLPHLVLLPAGVWMVDRVGFAPVLAAGAAPLLGLLALPLLPPLKAGGPGARAVAEPRGWRIPGATGPVLAMLSCATA
jgi:MFS family permease